LLFSCSQFTVCHFINHIGRLKLWPCFEGVPSAEFPPPKPKGAPEIFGNILDLSGTQMDVKTIEATVRIVDQKGGQADNIPPNRPVPETTVTAVDSELVTNGTAVSSAPVSLTSFQKGP
jgi:hypothetical protein